MNKTVGLLLVVYALLLASLSYLPYHMTPALAFPTFIAGLAGGALCALWGVLAMSGKGPKGLAVLTLGAVTLVLLHQVLLSGTGDQQVVWAGKAVIIVLLAVSVAMLVRIAWSGVVFDLPSSTADTRRPQTSAKAATADKAQRRK